uniref:Putative LOC100634292 [Amphimedon queenslandica] n=1 Tax=Lepeophtheirus salmonis TaxID=72036 RepID=A0A0K2UZ12_LEPSM
MFLYYSLNVKLITMRLRMPKITVYPSYRHIIASLVCNPALFCSFFRKCENYRTPDLLKDKLLDHFEENSVDEVKFQQWISNDRSELTSIVLPIQNFVEIIYDKAEKLTRHNFIAKTQSNFLYNKKKSEIMEGEFVVNGDFSEKL